jgi:predicted dehydrogenase
MKAKTLLASDIKVGVVGYGGAFNMGRQHLLEMKQAGMTPVAVAEVDPERLRVATNDFPGIQTYSTIREMLRKSDVGLVVIITPHNTHSPIALECLKAGRHVVCEKPLAITTAEVDAMIAAAKKSRVMLSTYHNRHWDGCILEALDAVKKRGLIGDIVRIDCHMGGYGKPGDWWRTSRTISGGILYDWGVHLLEYSLQLIDAPVTEVSGFAHSGFWAPQTKWKADANEDEGFAVVRFKGPQWLTLRISTIASNPPEGWLEIVGTKGAITFEGSHHKLFQHGKNRQIITRIANRPSEGHRYYENVRDHLVNGDPLVITAEWSRRPIHILDLAVKSAKVGKALPVKYP